MGIFSPRRTSYAPPLDPTDELTDSRPTFLGTGELPVKRVTEDGSDKGLLSVADRGATDDNVQIAQVPRDGVTGPDAMRVANPPMIAAPYNAERAWMSPLGDSGTEPPPGSPVFEDAMTKAVGHPIVLPDGSRVADPNSDSGYLMSPVPDLKAVAAAGRRVKREFTEKAGTPETAPEANAYLYTATGVHVGQGGVFDYQRDGNRITGWTQYPHFRDVSNFNVGLFCQQAGISLGDALLMAGAQSFIGGKTDRNQPYWVQRRTAEFIRRGYEAGESGVFGSSEDR